MSEETHAATYASYLKIDELLSLQQPRSAGPEHDETLFIVIHQVYELWFKELLHELDRVMRLLEADDPHRSQHTLKRILTILKVMVAQLDILETMTPLEFLSFRERLDAASGFQSDQFRQLEFVLGVKSEQTLRRFPEGSRARAALERRYRAPTLWDAFLHYPCARVTRSTVRISPATWSPRSNRRRTSSGSSLTSTAAIPRMPSSVNASSIWTKASRSGATAT